MKPPVDRNEAPPGDEGAVPAAGCSFSHRGKIISSDTYGPGYLADFERVLRYAGRNPIGRVLEWGSGLTSLALLRHCTRWGVELFLSIDEDRDYLASVFRAVPRPPFLHPRAIGLTGPCIGQRDPEPNYSTLPLTYGGTFDLIVIDGRRRVECAYVAALLAHPETVVAVHDYRRGRYQPMLGLFAVIADSAHFRVMRPRPAVIAALAPERERVLDAMKGLDRRGE